MGGVLSQRDIASQVNGSLSNTGETDIRRGFDGSTRWVQEGNGKPKHVNISYDHDNDVDIGRRDTFKKTTFFGQGIMAAWLHGNSLNRTAHGHPASNSAIFDAVKFAARIMRTIDEMFPIPRSRTS
jgi:hypothetical protein